MVDLKLAAQKERACKSKGNIAFADNCDFAADFRQRYACLCRSDYSITRNHNGPAARKRAYRGGNRGICAGCLSGAVQVHGICSANAGYKRQEQQYRNDESSHDRSLLF